MINFVKGSDYAQYINLVHTAELENGSLVGQGAVDATILGDEVFTAVEPATADLGTELYLIAVNDDFGYDDSTTASDYKIAIGEIILGVIPENGQRFVMSEDLFSSAPTVGEFVVPADGSFLFAPAEDLTGATKVYGKVLLETTIGYDQTVAYKIEIRVA